MKKKKKLIFQDDDELEEFYEKYGYEPDEQGNDVLDKIIPELFIDINCNHWISQIFSTDTIIQLPDDLKLLF